MNSLEKLQGVIADNRHKQEEAGRLNVRAGNVTFLIMSKNDWEKWLKERLGGARRVAEIVNFETIKLPPLNSATVQKILSDNPDTIQVEGQTLDIEYGRGYWGNEYFVRANVSEELARRTKTVNLFLPGGRAVELCCGGHKEKSFPELAEKLEKTRIERTWEEKRRELEHNSWMSKTEDVFSHLPKLLSAVEITRANNGEGEPIFGFFSLYSDFVPDFKINIKATKEEAEKETGVSLEKLLRKATRDAMVIPQEEPWQIKGHWSSWTLTKLGKELNAQLEKILNENLHDLNAGNIIERVELLKQSATTVKNELGGEYVAVKELIEKTDAELNDNINAVAEGRRLVQAEIDRSIELISSAKGRFVLMAFHEAKDACEKTLELSRQLPELCNARQERRRQAEEVELEISEDLYNLKNGCGEFSDVDTGLSMEANRLSQQISEALSDNYFEMFDDKVEEAKLLLSSVRSMLLSKKRNGFIDTGNRYFQCKCGCQIRANKGDWQVYQSGQPIKISCLGCNFTETVTKK